MRTIVIMGNKISENSLNKSSYILTIPTDKVGLLDVEKADSCFQYGYNTTISQIEELKKSLGQKSFDPKWTSAQKRTDTKLTQSIDFKRIY